MKPILFSENSTSFTTNGIGRLSDAISCTVTEERNGLYELEMEYPIDGQHYSDIAIRSIIAAVPCDGGSIQAFRVYKISKPISGRVAIYARHISYDLSKNTAMPFSIAASPSACASTLSGLKTHAVETCPFTFWTDVTTAGSYAQPVPASIRSRLGGVEGSVLDQFGGEYEWDNFTVKLHRQRGTLAVNNGITLRYGKNITDITQEENIADTATGVVPYWADIDGNIVTLPEKAVYSPNASKYSQKLTVPLDLSDNWEEAPTVAELRAAAQVVVNASAFGVPKVSIEVSFIALWQTEEYKDIAPLQRVRLCDEVTVSFERLGVDAVAKVVKTEYDVLAERYRSIQIGSIRSNLATTLNDQTAQTLREIEAQAVSASQAINNATKWLTSAGGYVIAIKNTDGTWKELIFSNMTDPYNSNAKILRINNNGIGFSLNGMNGTFRNAWTIDGNLVADFIHGGTLTLGGNNNGNGVLSFVDANTHEIIRIDRTGAYFYVWTYANGQWTKTNIGSWTPSGLTLTKGAINLGLRTDVSPNRYRFSVTDAGAMHAESGNIGGFTLDATDLRSGDLTSTSDGAVGISNADFARSINGTSRAGLRFAIGANFGVNKSGNIFAAGATIDGSITSKDGTTRTTSISGGKIIVDTPSGGVYDQIQFKRGDEYIEMGAHRVFWTDGEGHSVNATWEKIIEAANRPTT